MTQKTPSEIIDFILDQKATSLNAQVGDEYISYMKLSVGNATFVYSSHGFDYSFMESLYNTFSLNAIVAGDIVYVINSGNLFGTFLDFSEDFPNVKDFKDYVDASNKKAYNIYREWYNDLLLNQVVIKGDNEFSHDGKNSKHYTEPPKTHGFITSDVAAKFLTGSLLLKDFVLQQLEAKKEDYLLSKFS